MDFRKGSTTSVMWQVLANELRMQPVPSLCNDGDGMHCNIGGFDGSPGHCQSTDLQGIAKGSKTSTPPRFPSTGERRHAAHAR
jgi:hypothetical protein